MRKNAPRLLIAGTGSGCGKTTMMCAILRALKDRGHGVASFKCGPDYIDPMFHREIIGAPGANIDLFFCGEAQARALFAGRAGDLNVIEGVMGYYDGLSMDSPQASAWHVARALSAPAVLVVNARGMALSTAAVVKGYLALRKPSGIAGVLLNNASEATFPGYRAAIERECGMKVYGYLPPLPECALASRHLGLVTAQEVADLREKMRLLAAQAEKSLDLDGLIALMQAQPPLEAQAPSFARIGDARIAVARDAAFCFYYPEALELLERLGAELVWFSPIHDARLPECDGLLLGGGYPELHADALSANAGMRASIRDAVRSGLPTIAECGGFMYLTDQIGDRAMVGAIHARCSDRKRLTRFGYATLTAQRDSLLLAAGESMPAHEFHHWDADDPGGDMVAEKPSGRRWACIHATEKLYAGFPHLYLPAHPRAAERFVRKCMERKQGR